MVIYEEDNFEVAGEDVCVCLGECIVFMATKMELSYAQRVLLVSR